MKLMTWLFGKRIDPALEADLKEIGSEFNLTPKRLQELIFERHPVRNPEHVKWFVNACRMGGEIKAKHARCGFCNRLNLDFEKSGFLYKWHKWQRKHLPVCGLCHD